MTTSRRTERYELVVIGGGQAGLAAGYWLGQYDIDFLIVDANARTGDSWRARWDSLQLFTPARYSGLPGLPLSGDPYHFPTRDEMADYMEWYAQVFELPVRHGVHVSRVRRITHGYAIETNGVTLEADNVLVATGPFQVPRLPDFSKHIAANVVQLHSSEYQNPAQLPDGPVLVVGAGNSGAQIALELAKSREVILAGPSVGSMRRRLLGRDIFDWLSRTLMVPGADSFVGKHIRSNVLNSSDGLIGMTEDNLCVPNLRRATGHVSLQHGKLHVSGAEIDDVASMVWSTGFRPDFSFVDVPVFSADGFPMHHRGVTNSPGLYFLGLRFLHRLNSSLVGGVGADAQFVANAIAARYGHTRRLKHVSR